MVRYLDNKVVTIKGERYTEIKEETEASKEEAKKTFVTLKPARQYRFHWQRLNEEDCRQPVLAKLIIVGHVRWLDSMHPCKIKSLKQKIS